MNFFVLESDERKIWHTGKDFTSNELWLNFFIVESDDGMKNDEKVEILMLLINILFIKEVDIIVSFVTKRQLR